MVSRHTIIIIGIRVIILYMNSVQVFMILATSDKSCMIKEAQIATYTRVLFTKIYTSITFM